jgi:hypothetical protein
MAGMLAIVDKGWGENDGADGFTRLLDDRSAELRDLKGGMDAEDERQATMFGQIGQWIEGDVEEGTFKSAHVQLNELSEGLKQSANAAAQEAVSLESAKGKLNKSKAKKFRKDVEVIQEAIAFIADITKNNNLNGDNVDALRQDFARVNSLVSKKLNKNQNKFLDNARVLFSGLEKTVRAESALNGATMGKIHNYLPLATYNDSEDVDKNFNEVTRIKASETANVKHRDVANTRLKPLNLHGVSTFRTSFRGLAYSAYTGGAYSTVSAMYGVEDLNGEIDYSIFAEEVALETDHLEQRRLKESLEFGTAKIKQKLDRDKTIVLEDSTASRAFFALNAFGIKTVLMSFSQLPRQTISALLPAMITSPNMIPEILKGLTSFMIDKQGRANMAANMRQHAPHLYLRGLAGVDVYDQKIESMLAGIETKLLSNEPSKLVLKGLGKTADGINATLDFGMKHLLQKPDAWVSQSLVRAEYKRITGNDLSATNPNDVDRVAMHDAVVFTESIIGQSDQTKKGAWQQKDPKMAANMLRQSFMALSSTQLSIMSSARAGLSLIRQGDRAEGARLVANTAIQSIAYRALSTPIITSLIAGALALLTGHDHEELEEDMLKFTADYMFWYDPTRRKPMTDEKWAHSFALSTAVDLGGMIPGVGAAFAVSSTSQVIREVAGSTVETYTGLERPGEGFVLGDAEQALSLFGPSTILLQRGNQLINTYTNEQVESELELLDLGYILSNILSMREYNAFFKREVQTKREVPVFEGEGGTAGQKKIKSMLDY